MLKVSRNLGAQVMVITYDAAGLYPSLYSEGSLSGHRQTGQNSQMGGSVRFGHTDRTTARYAIHATLVPCTTRIH